MRLEGHPADKPGRLVPEDGQVEIVEDLHPFVGRGGVKLAHALDRFGVSPQGRVALDVGASTGGFTDCLLQRGAEKVFAVDVGYGQLDWKIQRDPRVVILDRKNARELSSGDLGEAVDLAVIDVSFISLRLVIPPVLAVLKSGGDLVALVKPQFEVGKGEVEKKGIVRDPEKHWKVLWELREFIATLGWVVQGVSPSPITGQKGNQEFLIHAVNRGHGTPIEEEAMRRAMFP